VERVEKTEKKIGYHQICNANQSIINPAQIQPIGQPMMELHRRCAVCRGLLVRFSSRTRNSPLSRPVIFIAAMVLPTWEQYYTATLFCTKHHENRSSASEGVEKYNLSNSIGRLA